MLFPLLSPYDEQYVFQPIDYLVIISCLRHLTFGLLFLPILCPYGTNINFSVLLIFKSSVRNIILVVYNQIN
jgi:hypothetical protein